MGRTAIGPCEHAPTVSSTPPPGGIPEGVSLKQEKPPRLKGLCILVGSCNKVL